MSRLNDLLRELRTREPALARDLEREVAALADRRAFGLNFERHVPEAVELPGRKVRKGDKVRILPPLGQRPKKSNEKLWRVVGIDRSASTADLEPLTAPVSDSMDQVVEAHEAGEKTTAALSDLVVVAEFRDPIYPGLVSTGKVERGGDKPFHTVINAENFHALETLLFTHRGRVDCIYIDPPYNSGAKDWKYNNDYVEADDLYRHSKWLAMMERRLLIARELLNPLESVLIVTIDEREYLRLGLLLEQVFENAKIQMISSVISPSGAARNIEFTRVNEFVFFVMIGDSIPIKTPDDMLFTDNRTEKENRSPIWNQLRRLGAGPARSDSPSKFYPVLIDPQTGAVVASGAPLAPGQARKDYSPPKGLVGTWPTMTNGEDGRWELNRSSFEARLASGQIRTNGEGRSGDWNVQYLRNAQIERLASGELIVTGRSPQGWLEIDYAAGRPRVLYAKTVWNKSSHDSRTYGSWLLRSLIPGRKFPFPKSLYAVEDALRFFIGNKPNAIVLDYFSGSGTTTHAVLRLNRQDNGRRQSLCVTNNEVAADEQAALRENRLRPGDSEWEQHGICDHITKPRVQAAISGMTPEHEPIDGEYKFIDEFPMAEGFEENAEFFTLTYEAPLRVASNREFTKVAPLLWLRAGSRGRRIDDISKGWDVADVYGVLANLDHTQDFLEAIAVNDTVAIAFIVTDEERLFESVAQALPEHVEPIRLYEAYLRNFEIESGRGSL